MDCMYSDRMDHYCQLGYNPDTGEADTENYPIDENGICEVEGDEFPGDSCPDFSGGWGTCWRCGENPEDCICGENEEEEEEVCDECGEPLGFCAPDCPTREEGYEDD